MSADLKEDTTTLEPRISFKADKVCNQFSVTIESDRGNFARSSITGLYSPFSTSETSQSHLLCEGDSIKISIVTYGDVEDLRYQWYRGDTLLGGVNDGVLFFKEITRVNSGEYMCWIRHPSGRALHSIVDIDVVKKPIYQSNLPDSISIQDPSIVLIGSPEGGEFIGNGITSNIFDPASAGEGTHVLTYSYRDSICSANYMDTVTVLGMTTSPAVIDARQLRVFPNPNDGSFQIILGETPIIDQWKITNILGQELNPVYQLSEGGRIRVDLHADAGIYLIILKSSVDRVSIPFLVTGDR